jgi:hypothetical protein
MPPSKRHNHALPQIAFGTDAKGLFLRIAGESYPEDAETLYAPMLQWLEEVLRDTPQSVPLHVELSLHYINTASQKVLLTLVDNLRHHYLDSNRSVHTVYRVHEDDDDVYDMARELFEDWDASNYTIERYA